MVAKAASSYCLCHLVVVFPFTQMGRGYNAVALELMKYDCPTGMGIALWGFRFNNWIIGSFLRPKFHILFCTSVFKCAPIKYVLVSYSQAYKPNKGDELNSRSV